MSSWSSSTESYACVRCGCRYLVDAGHYAARSATTMVERPRFGTPQPSWTSRGMTYARDYMLCVACVERPRVDAELPVEVAAQVVVAASLSFRRRRLSPRTLDLAASAIHLGGVGALRDLGYTDPAWSSHWGR